MKMVIITIQKRRKQICPILFLQLLLQVVVLLLVVVANTIAFSPSNIIHKTKPTTQAIANTIFCCHNNLQQTTLQHHNVRIMQPVLISYTPSQKKHMRTTISNKCIALSMSSASNNINSKTEIEDGSSIRIIPDSIVEETNINSSNSNHPVTRLQRIKSKIFTRWGSRSKQPNDGTNTTTTTTTISAKERLAKMGLAAALSYGWVSNMSYSVTVSIAWYIFSKQTGMSPLQPGQWKGFLAVYAGFWIFNNIVRPIRIGVSIAISPAFDKVIASIQKRMNVSKPVAVGITVVLANVVGTISFMSAGIVAASILSGVPIFQTTTVPVATAKRFLKM